MHAAITLSDLSFTTADGHTLFKNIDAFFGSGLTGLVGRNGVGKTTLLHLIAGDLLPSSGAVSVSGRLAMFQQAVRPKEGLSIADCFGIGPMLEIIDAAERGMATAEMLSEVDWLAEERAMSALARFGLSYPLSMPLSRLSGGEQTRAQLAALMFTAPDFVLLDEPTNNLDAEGRAKLIGFLADWRGGALVVSHDRALLDTMTGIAELTSTGLARYGGNFSFYEQQKKAELVAYEQAVDVAQRTVRQSADAARQRATRKARSDAKGQKGRARGDAPKILLDAAKERAEATGARQSALSDRQAEKAAEALESAKAKLEVVAPLSIALSPSGLVAGRRVLKVGALSVGYQKEKPLCAGVSFEMIGPQRWAIGGRNGAGKSTLIKTLTGDLAPLDGTADIYVPYAVFDQAVSLLDPKASVRENFRRWNLDDDENACRAALARFRFRADAALQQVSTLSGGELLRAGLAVAIGGNRPAQLLILDEPTNHLDIETLATLEQGFNEYDGALLIISHDSVFLERIGVSETIMPG